MALPNMLNTFDPRVVAGIIRIDRQYLTNVAKYDSVDTALIQDYRDYVDGDQPDALTTTQAALLGGDLNYTLNVTETIVSVIADRLKARGIEVVETEQEKPAPEPITPIVQPVAPDPEQMEADDSEDTQPAPPVELPETEPEPTLAEQLNPVIRKLWDDNHMDERQADIHWMAGRDGRAFVMPEYNADEGTVDWAINAAFDGASGVRMVYSEDNYKPLYAVKRWSVVPHPADKDQNTTVKRMNVYYPDRIEEWVSRSAALSSANTSENWQPLDPTNTEMITSEHGSYKATVKWWTDAIETQDITDSITGETMRQTIIGRGGRPLGIPVFHFKANAQGNAEGKSDVAQIVPGQQDVINRANAMISAGEQFMGTPTLFIISNSTIEELEFFPGSPIQLAENSNVIVAPAADLTQLNASLDAKIARAATLSRIPVAYFNVTGQIAAEGTQKQMEVLLTARVEKRQKAFGNCYEGLVRMSLKLMAMFDPEFTLFSVETLDEIDDLSLSCSWEPAEIRNETEDTQRAQTEKDMGFPIEIYGETAGLTTDQITLVKSHEAEQKHLADIKNQQMLAALAEELGKDGETNQPQNGSTSNPVSAPGSPLGGLSGAMGGIRGG